MEIVKIDLGERAYDICVGTKLLSKEDLLLRHISNKNVAIISNENVGPLYLEKLKKVLLSLNQSLILFLKMGRSIKIKRVWILFMRLY